MLIWGTRGNAVKMGPGPTQNCPNCAQTRSFSYWVQYKIFHLWYLIRLVTSKNYMLACDVCERGTTVPQDQAMATATTNPIHWFDRFSWLIPTGAVAVFCAVLGIISVIDNQRDARFTADPKVGDLYVLDLAVNNPNPAMRNMYAVGRVSSVENERVTLQIATQYHDRQKTADREIRGGDYDRARFFTNTPRTLTRAELTQMHDDGAIVDVERPE